jgi:sterigmatocystin biosynthesis cytochrome P450 monooxygenase
VCSNGHQWKIWRAIFSPGFSTKNVMALAPSMLEELLVFRSLLKDAATTGKVVKVDTMAMKATVDVIGRAVVYVDLALRCFA